MEDTEHYDKAAIVAEPLIVYGQDTHPQAYAMNRTASRSNVILMAERLQELSALPEGWDGFGAKPVSPQALYNINKVLQKCTDDDVAGWHIFPETNGTLCMDSDERDASISIGKDEFSFASLKKDVGESHIPFQRDLFLTIMRGL